MTEGEKSSSGIIIGIIIFVLAGLAVTFFILWILQRKTGTPSPTPGTLSIVNPVFTSGNTSATATWMSTGNTEDVVTLFADTAMPVFDNSGLTTASILRISVPASAKTVTLNGLRTNVRYYVSLVVTNPNIPGYNVTNSVIFTGSVIPTTTFIMQDINMLGSITLNPNSSTGVSYVLGVNKTTLGDLWSYDTTTRMLFARGIGANSGNIYYLSGIGGMVSVDTNSTPTADKIWSYVNNQWCLGTTNTCISLVNGMLLMSPSSTSRFINVPTSIF